MAKELVFSPGKPTAAPDCAIPISVLVAVMMVNSTYTLPVWEDVDLTQPDPDEFVQVAVRSPLESPRSPSLSPGANVVDQANGLPLGSKEN
nr:MAG TPA: hypothetical protein [Caudoviricetes sp.]DAU40485.1 MAG TPA: hypothetical protein [Caudoviricetes sp.]